MIIKIGDEFFTDPNIPVMVVFSETEIKMLRENVNNPKWKGKMADSLFNHFHSHEAQLKWMDDIPANIKHKKESNLPYINAIEE